MKILQCIIASAVLCFSVVAYAQDTSATGGTSLKYLALTFDDGPDEKLTPLLLDMLKKYDAKVTFFVWGQKIETHALLIKRMTDEGHSVGNHTLSHQKLTSLSEENVRSEIESINALLQKVTSMSPTVFRPPYGAINEYVVEQARKNNLAIILWGINPEDSSMFSDAKAISSHIISHAKDGGIVFMHDTYQRSVEATEAVIQDLSKQGFVFVTVPELIQKYGTLQAGGIYKNGKGDGEK